MRGFDFLWVHATQQSRGHAIAEPRRPGEYHPERDRYTKRKCSCQLGRASY